ncbi:hypothetical protein EDB83DRAFT_2320027 [Lactarius deliciosus]|nr:hypothetical protein EDB83DRAFT_2320027 [Lactarius deliciosus]
MTLQSSPDFLSSGRSVVLCCQGNPMASYVLEEMRGGSCSDYKNSNLRSSFYYSLVFIHEETKSTTTHQSSTMPHLSNSHGTPVPLSASVIMTANPPPQSLRQDHNDYNHDDYNHNHYNHNYNYDHNHNHNHDYDDHNHDYDYNNATQCDTQGDMVMTPVQLIDISTYKGKVAHSSHWWSAPGVAVGLWDHGVMARITWSASEQ